MKTIGVIIRGKHSEEHNPDLLEQHADVLLSDGSPIGYYGIGGNGAKAEKGMGMEGVVYDYAALQINRPYYVDLEKAVQNGVVSTLCLLQVDDETARRFDEYWANMSKPGVAAKNGFDIIGNNCSTNAARAFEYAGVTNGPIPHLDTPQHLFVQLRAKYGSAFKCGSGYVGFQRSGNQMRIQMVPWEKRQ